MCGRFAQGEFPAKLRRILRELYMEMHGMNLNLPPGEAASIIAQGENQEAVVKNMEWGFKPSWNPQTLLINARSESVVEKPTFRNAFRCRRCLIPALGFYEWRREAGKKTPFYFSATNEEYPLVMGGVMESSHFVILTTAANETMKPVHDRMPVILQPDDWQDWLNPQCDDFNHLNNLMLPVADDYLSCREVSPYVNNVKNKGVECIQPVNHFFN